jgi:hypothetical protein
VQLPSLNTGSLGADALGSAERTVDASRRFGLLGAAIAVAGFALQAVVVVSNSGALTAIRDGNLSDLILFIPFAIGAAGLAVIVLRRSWIAASTKPFNYTVSVEPIEHLEPDGTTRGTFPRIDGIRRLDWLGTDLTEMLSDQVSRFSWVDESELDKSDPSKWAAHVHIRGHYACREAHRPRGHREIQVRLWIRIGPPGAGEIFTVPVNYTLDPRSGLAEAVTQNDYEKIIYRVFVSVMTSLYQCLHADVKRKIEGLPPGRLRAAAYFHEAEDYEESGTIDAYVEAGKLYADAARCSPISSRIPARVVRSIPWWQARVHRQHILAAKARVGEARTCLYRYLLAHMSGQASTPVFEARPLLKEALGLLRDLPAEVPDRENTRHAATVTLALANAMTGAWGGARLALHQARAMTPSDSRWAALELFTAGILEHRAMSRLQYVRAAAERAPRWQVAQFRLVREMEMLWRRRESLERDVAIEIVDRYRSLNPGIVAGWESAAYMHWLLGEPSDLDMAEVLLERGRQYSEIQQDTFVSDIDYGLARVAAEKGDVPAAYKRYVDAIAGGVAPGVDNHYTRSAPYYTQTISARIFKRFATYRDRSEREIAKYVEGHPETRRMASSVRAFVLNDYGKAAMAYYEATGNAKFHDDATDAFREAGLLSTRFLEPHVNLYLASRPPSSDSPRARAEAEVQLGEITRLDPRWERGLLLDATAAAAGSAQAWRDGRTEEAVRLLERAKERIAEVLGSAWSEEPGCRGDGSLDARLAREAGAVERALAHTDEEWRGSLTVTQLNGMFTWCTMLWYHVDLSTHAALAAAGLSQKIARLYPEHPQLIRAQVSVVPPLIGWSAPEPELERLRQTVLRRALRDCEAGARVTTIPSPSDAARIRSARRVIEAGMQSGAAPEDVRLAQEAVREAFRTRLRHALDGLLIDPASTMRFAAWLIDEYDAVGDASAILRVVDRTAEDTASPTTLVALTDVILRREQDWDDVEGMRGVRLAVKLLARAARLDASAVPHEHVQSYYGRRLHTALTRLDGRAGVGSNGHRDHWRTETVRSLLSEPVPDTAISALDKWLSAATSAPSAVDRATASDIRSARKLLTV